nr:pyruvate dehydrogenase complex dihydrolipoamide acetyltransferase [endosymbiont of Acanthamoeba sp. UWC8]
MRKHNFVFEELMAIEILMPALSPTMTEGNLAKWLKKEGDTVKPGDIIAEIETDKAIMEVEAVDKGIIGKILVADKSEGVKVNQLIAILLESGEDHSAIEIILKKNGSSDQNTIASTEPTKQEQNTKPELPSAHISNSTNQARVFASPLAKRIAQLENIDLSTLSGTGPHGRIIKADVLNAESAPQPIVKASCSTFGRNPHEFSLTPLSQMRKVIAKRLVESKQTIPHFYLTIDCNIDKLLSLREEMNNKSVKVDGTPRYKISVNDIMIKAVANALRDTPQVNASYTDEGIKFYNNVDVSIAVAIDEGLITPIIRNADQKSLSMISNEMKELAKRAKANQLRPEEFQGGGFSITNLGMFGIKNFNAIVNPPQSAILAIGAGEERAAVINGEIKVVNMVSVTLSCDHRIVDGALGAEFLNKFKNFVECPGLMLV